MHLITPDHTPIHEPYKATFIGYGGNIYYSEKTGRTRFHGLPTLTDFVTFISQQETQIGIDDSWLTRFHRLCELNLKPAINHLFSEGGVILPNGYPAIVPDNPEVAEAASSIALAAAKVFAYDVHLSPERKLTLGNLRKLEIGTQEEWELVYQTTKIPKFHSSKPCLVLPNTLGDIYLQYDANGEHSLVGPQGIHFATEKLTQGCAKFNIEELHMRRLVSWYNVVSMCIKDFAIRNSLADTHY